MPGALPQVIQTAGSGNIHLQLLTAEIIVKAEGIFKFYFWQPFTRYFCANPVSLI